MIRVNRGSPPKEMQSQVIDLAYEKVEKFYLAKDRSQKRFDFGLNREVDALIKPILRKRFYGKCGYCETKIQRVGSGVIDRFRPHNGVRDEKEYFSDLYWWLVFDWDNLIYSCKECSQYKANYFPITRHRALSREDSVKLEGPLLLNPCSDTPEDHILMFMPSGEIIAKTLKGEQTIQLLNLNRNSLRKRRLAAVSRLHDAIDTIISRDTDEREQAARFLNEINELNPEIEYLFCLNSILQDNIDPVVASILRESAYLSIDVESDIHRKSKRIRRRTLKLKDAQKSDFFPIEYLEVKDFKAISKVKIEFPRNEIDQHSWISLLGENGLGKSSILQAFCLGLEPLFESGDPMIGNWIKNNKAEAVIKIKERDSDNLLVTRLIRDGNRVDHSGEFDSKVVGYGATRLLPDTDVSIEDVGKKKIRYQNLFNPTERLTNVHSWLGKVYSEEPKQFDAIAVALKKLLPEEVNEDLIMKKGRLTLKKSNMPYEGLSDGYKNTISLALDIMFVLSEGAVDIDKLNGFVVIDELGNQLHPRWQMKVVEQFRDVFPKVNFIVSTHHPLCLRGLKENETVVMKKNPNTGRIKAVSDLPLPDEFRVDQLLTSEFFGLHTTNDTDLESRFNEYYYLLAKNKLGKDETQRLEELKKELKDKKHLGDTLREELMYSVIDKLLAERMASDSRSNRKELKKKTIELVQQLWREHNFLD